MDDFHFIDEGFPARHSKTMACYVDDFHFIEEMFSNPIGFILVLDFFDFTKTYSQTFFDKIKESQSFKKNNDNLYIHLYILCR